MSWFGDFTFKQNVLEYIQDEARDKGLSLIEATCQTSDVLSHLVTLSLRDKELLRVATAEAKKELMERLQNDE